MLSACVTAHVVCPLAQVHVRYAFQTHDKLYLILDFKQVWAERDGEGQCRHWTPPLYSMLG